jgi:protein SCO1/2
MKTAIVAVLLSLLALPLANAQTDPTSNQAGPVPRSCCAAAPSADPASLPGKSLYQLDANWTNDLSKPMQLSALRGRPQIVTMFFANCQFACPMLVHKMKLIEAALPENVRTNVGFTLITFDTERDTPKALRSYRGRQELGSNWTLLHGNPGDVQELAAVLGVKFKKDSQGQFQHSNVITVLDADGEVVFQETGLGLEVTEVAHRIERLVNH